MDAATSISNGAPSNRLLEHHPGCRIPNCFCELWPSIVYNPSGPMYPKRYIDKFADDEVQYAKQKLQTKAERAAKVKEPVSNSNSASVAKSKRKRTAGEDELADDDDDGDSKYARHRDLMVRDLIECCLEAAPLDVLHSIPASTFRGDVDDAIAGNTVIYRLRDRMDFRRYPGLRDYLLNRHRNSMWQDSQADVEAVIRMLEAGTVTGKLTLGHITDLKHPLRVLNVDSAAGAFATVPLRAGEPLGVYPGVLTPYNELNGFMGRLPMSERSKIWSYDIEAPINGYSFHGAGVRNVLCGVNDFHGIDDEEGNSVSKVPLKLGGVIPMILFVTRRAIAQGQELTLSYGHEWSKVFTTYHPAAREIFFANKRDNEPSIGEMYQLVGLARAERTRSSLKLKAAGGADAVAAEMLKRATKVSQLKSASKQGPGGGAGSGSPAASNGLTCDTLGAVGAGAGGHASSTGASGYHPSSADSFSTASMTVGTGVAGVAAMSSGGHEAHSSLAPLPVPLPLSSTARMHTSTTYVPSPLAAVQRARESTASAVGGLSLSSVPVLQATPAGVGGAAGLGTASTGGGGHGHGYVGTKVDFVTQVAAAVSTGKLALAPGASASDESALRARVASVGHYDHLGAGTDCGLCPSLKGTLPPSSSSSSSAPSGSGHAAGTHALLLCRYKSWEEASKKLNFAVAARVAVAEAAAVAAQRAKRAAALALQRAEEGRRAAAAAAAASPVAKTPGRRKLASGKVRKAAVRADAGAVGAASALRGGGTGKSKGSRDEQAKEEEEEEEELDEGEEAEGEEEDAGASSSVPVFVPPPPPVLAPLPAEPSLLLVDVSEVLASLDALEEARASSPTGTAEASSGEERYTEVLASLLCKAVEAGVAMTDGSELVPGIVLPAGVSAEQGAEASPKDGLPQPSPTASASSAASGAGFVPIPPEPRRAAVLSRIRDWVDEQREVANTYADALDAREAALAAHASAVAIALAEAQAAAAAATSASKVRAGAGKDKGKGSAHKGKGGKGAAKAGKSQGKRQREEEEEGGGEDATAAALGDSARKKKKKGDVSAGEAGTAGGNTAKKEARAARKAAKKVARAAKAAKKAGRPAAAAAAIAEGSAVASTPATHSKDKAGAKRAASASAAGKDKGGSTAKKARVSSAGASGESSTTAASAAPPAAAAAVVHVDVLSLGTKEYNSYVATLPSHLQEAVAIPGLSRIQQRQLLASMLAEHVSGGSQGGGAAPTHTPAHTQAGSGGTGEEGHKRTGKGKVAEAVAEAGSAPSSAPESGGVVEGSGTGAQASVAAHPTV